MGLESLTPEGILIDSQINARKIRIDNVRDLFDRLREDPESPVGIMVENLIGILEEELAKAETNVDTVQQITDSIFAFLATFDLKANNEVLARRIEQVSQESATENPDLPDYLSESKSYIEMLQTNHGFDDDTISAFTNTKLLYYLASDIAAILRGPVSNTNTMFTNRNNLDGAAGSVTYPNPLHFKSSGNTPQAPPIRRHSNHIFVDEKYNNGKLTLDQTQSYYGIGSLTKKWATKHGTSAKDGISVLLETICSDFARSAAIGSNNELIGNDVFNIFKNLPKHTGVDGKEKINKNFIRTDASFTSIILKGASTGKLIAVFDRNISDDSSSIADGPAGTATIINNIADEIIPELINSDAVKRNRGIETTELLTGDIISKLRSSADAVELAMGLNKPMLDPVNVLDKILSVFWNLINDSNPTLTDAGFSSLKMFQLASLTEAWTLASHTSNRKISYNELKTSANEGSQYEIFFAHFQTLLTSLVLSAGSNLTEDSSSFFNNLDQEDTSDLIIDAMRNTLVSAPIISGNDGTIISRQNIANLIAGKSTVEEIFKQGDYKTLDEFKAKLVFINHWSGHAERVDYDDGNESDTIGTRYTTTGGSGAGISPILKVSNPETPYRTETSLTFARFLKEAAANGNDISMSIAQILKDIYDDASSSLPEGSILEIDDNKKTFKSSGVDHKAIASLMVSVFSLISKSYCKVNFITYSSVHNGKVLEQYKADPPVGFQLASKTAIMRFYNDLSAYLENKNISDIPVGNSPIRDLLTTVKRDSMRHRKPATDFVIFCRALADEISSKSQALISSFKDSADDDQTDRVDRSFLESEKHFEKILDYSQINVSRNWISSLRQREGANKYFDNFFASKAEENFFYTMARDSRFTFPKGDNLRIMSIGIPYGFTKSALGIDPLLNPDEFANNRKVKIEISKYDVILGNVVETKPKVFLFDLSIFFKEVTDPTESSPNPEIIDGTSVDLSKAVTDREYPDPVNAKSNIIFEKLDLVNKTKTDINYDLNSSDNSKKMFSDHLDDYLAKTYIKIAYGIDLSERSFYIDAKDEKIVSSEDERKRMNDLISEHLKKLTGKDLTMDSYLAGNRKTREAYDRLKEGKRTKSVIEDIDSNIEGVSPESGQIAADDIVTFTQMMGANNPFITPSSTRRKITKPKLFERVFCIMLDPDDFEIENTDALRALGTDNFISKYVDTTLPVYEYKDNKRADGNPQAGQYLVRITKLFPGNE